MDAVFDHSLAADDDRLYQPPSRDERIFIEPQITATPAQIRMVAIEHDDVGSPTRRDRADRSPERLGAAGERVCIKTARGGLSLALRQHVAGAMAQTLVVFELPQLGSAIEFDVRIGSNTEAPTRSRVAIGVEDTIAEIGFSQWTQPGDRARGRERLRFAVPSCALREQGTTAGQ